MAWNIAFTYLYELYLTGWRLCYKRLYRPNQQGHCHLIDFSPSPALVSYEYMCRGIDKVASYNLLRSNCIAIHHGISTDKCNVVTHLSCGFILPDLLLLPDRWSQVHSICATLRLRWHWQEPSTDPTLFTIITSEAHLMLKLIPRSWNDRLPLLPYCSILRLVTCSKHAIDASISIRVRLIISAPLER